VSGRWYPCASLRAIARTDPEGETQARAGAAWAMKSTDML